LVQERSKRQFAMACSTLALYVPDPLTEAAVVSPLSCASACLTAVLPHLPLAKPSRGLIERDPIWQIDRHLDHSETTIRDQRFSLQDKQSRNSASVAAPFADSVWPASILLSELLAVWVEQQDVTGVAHAESSLELGCGCSALPSRMLQRCCESLDVAVTSDLEEDTLVRSYNDSHDSEDQTLVDEYVAFDWASSLPPRLQRRFDLILGADLVYNVNCHVHLVRTLAHLMYQPCSQDSEALKSPLAILAHPERNDTHAKFMHELKQWSTENADRPLYFWHTLSPPGISMIGRRKHATAASMRIRFVFISSDEAFINVLSVGR